MKAVQYLTNLLKWKWPSLPSIDTHDLGSLNELIASDPELIARIGEFIVELNPNTPPGFIDFSDDVFSMNFGNRMYVHMPANPDPDYSIRPPFVLCVCDNGGVSNDGVYDYHHPKDAARALIAIL